MLAKHCLQEFKLDCQLRRLSDRTIKGYYNNTMNFLIYAEKHHEVTEVDNMYEWLKRNHQKCFIIKSAPP